MYSNFYLALLIYEMYIVDCTKFGQMSQIST